MAESPGETVSLDSGLPAWVAAIRAQPRLLGALNQITRDTVESVADYIAQLTVEELDEATRRRIDASLAKAHSGEILELAGAVLTFFSLLPADIPLSTALATLAGTGDLQPELVPPIEERLSFIFERGNVAAAIQEQQRDSALGLAIPMFQGAWTRCIGVARFNPEYDMRQRVDQYAPLIAGVTPAVVLQIDITKYGSTENLAIGLTPKDLGRLIRRLQFAECQLRAYAKRLATLVEGSDAQEK